MNEVTELQDKAINQLIKAGFRVNLNGVYGTHMSKRVKHSTYSTTVGPDGLMDGQYTVAETIEDSKEFLY